MSIFDIINLILLLMIVGIMIYPLLNTLAVSLSSFKAYASNPTMIIPSDITLSAYESIFNNRLLGQCYFNTLFVTFVGTAINMILTIITAYPLSKRNIKGISAITFFFIFTMMFSGGMIPEYLVVKSLGLLNTRWVLMLPMAINTYNLILVKSYYSSIPASLEESAAIEGAGAFRTLFYIIIPVSIPTLVAVTLFYTVANWNQYFLAVIYINKKELWTLQVLLREVVSNNANLLESVDANSAITPYVVRCATIMVVVLPIICVYPFLQKYFISGIMLGAVKE